MTQRRQTRRRTASRRRGRGTAVKRHHPLIALAIILWRTWTLIPARHRPYILLISAALAAGLMMWGRDGWWQAAYPLTGLWLLQFGTWTAFRVRSCGRTGTARPRWFRFPDRYVVEWWRKGRVIRQWRRLCDRENWLTQRRGKPIPLRVKATPAGDIVGVCDPGGVALRKEDIESEALRLRNTIGCKEVAVRDHPRKVGLLVVTFFYTDPLERTLTIQDLPLPPPPVQQPDGTLLQKFVAYGIREDGKTATHDQELAVLVIGMPGMGKSSFGWTELANYIREKIPIEVWAADLKGGMEMSALRKTKERQFPDHKDTPVVPRKTKPNGQVDNPLFIVRAYTRTVTQTNEMLAELKETLEHRQRYLDDQGMRNHVPSVQHPRIILILDEFLMLHDQCMKGATSDLGVILTQGRAPGIRPIGLAQTGHASELGVIRTFFPIRRVFAMPSATATQTAIGATENESGAFCSKLSEVTDRGICYAISEGARRAQRERVAYVNDVPYKEGPFEGESDLTMIASGRLPWGMRTLQDEPKRWCTYQFWGFEDPITHGRPFRYVGKVDDRKRLEERMQEHRRDDKEWWHLVDESTMVVLDHPTKKAMLAAEQQMIRELKPTHNVQGQRNNPGQRRRRQSIRLKEERERALRAARENLESGGRQRSTVDAVPPVPDDGEPVHVPADYLNYGDEVPGDKTQDREEVDA
jgi:hypothetical protein